MQIEGKGSCSRDHGIYFVTFREIQLERGGTRKVAWHELEMGGKSKGRGLKSVQLSAFSGFSGFESPGMGIVVYMYIWLFGMVSCLSSVGIEFHFGPSVVLQTHEFHGILKSKKTGRKQTISAKKAPP